MPRLLTPLTQERLALGSESESVSTTTIDDPSIFEVDTQEENEESMTKDLYALKL